MAAPSRGPAAARILAPAFLGETPRPARAIGRRLAHAGLLLALGLPLQGRAAAQTPDLPTFTPRGQQSPAQPTPSVKPAARPNADAAKKANGKPVITTASLPEGGAPPDIAYGAYQRGHYLTAFNEALKRARAGRDPAAKTLIGELYQRGYGVAYDPAKARDWYEQARKEGSVNAVFALGLMALTGEGGKKDAAQAANLFEEAAKQSHAAAAYNLGLLYMQGEARPKDLALAARWFRVASDKDVADAIYALAVLTKEGNGVEKDVAEAARLMERAADLGHVTAEVEYAIMLFNGTGVTKNEAAAARHFRHAALTGNAIAQNRYARILSAGRGAKQDLAMAATWHLVAKKRGLGDPYLDEVVEKLGPEDKRKAQSLAVKWSGG